MYVGVLFSWRLCAVFTTMCLLLLMIPWEVLMDLDGSPFRKILSVDVCGVLLVRLIFQTWRREGRWYFDFLSVRNSIFLSAQLGGRIYLHRVSCSLWYSVCRLWDRNRLQDMIYLLSSRLLFHGAILTLLVYPSMPCIHFISAFSALPTVIDFLSFFTIDKITRHIF